ncbi:hypothetical protein MUCCIDRAFT_77563 [Mucor lusitanicus CBS 277.49]|uniref:Late embryogenesis abundant protein LEA-2 subgroup domain-containing protein n=1 Tax=Mucor lusitanicus CBS 277.49 TaxID=747725 RepID=A0A168PB77_MUCCL|nr:hypothetical protein MUCCIDRAFT_77563 [Mucor lusitanicus CBS 277.49]
MASHQLPPLTTVDSSFMPDQSNDEYVMRKEEKTAVEHCEQVPEGVLAALFKIPEVNFNGPTKHPAGYAPFEKSNDTLAFSVNFGLQIGVVNDNAYYPTAPKVSVGGGEILNVHIQSYGITNFTFPFSIKYDPMKDEGYAMLTDIASKCGLLGGSNKEDLYIEYDLIPTIRIAGIAISPTIHQSSHFPCPISSGQLTMGLTASFNEDGDDEGDEDEED